MFAVKIAIDNPDQALKPGMPPTRLIVTSGEKKVIHARNNSKGFGETRAVADLSFSVHGGEIFGLSVRTGPGKSTLLRYDRGHTPARQRKNSGWEASTLPGSFHVKENLAYMPQRFGLYEEPDRGGEHSFLRACLRRFPARDQGARKGPVRVPQARSLQGPPGRKTLRAA